MVTAPNTVWACLQNPHTEARMFIHVEQSIRQKIVLVVFLFDWTILCLDVDKQWVQLLYILKRVASLLCCDRGLFSLFKAASKLAVACCLRSCESRCTTTHSIVMRPRRQHHRCLGSLPLCIVVTFRSCTKAQSNEEHSLKAFGDALEASKPRSLEAAKPRSHEALKP